MMVRATEKKNNVPVLGSLEIIDYGTGVVVVVGQ
jgi:hypothetical protein